MQQLFASGGKKNIFLCLGTVLEITRFIWNIWASKGCCFWTILIFKVEECGHRRKDCWNSTDERMLPLYRRKKWDSTDEWMLPQFRRNKVSDNTGQRMLSLYRRKNAQFMKLKGYCHQTEENNAETMQMKECYQHADEKLLRQHRWTDAAIM